MRSTCEKGVAALFVFWVVLACSGADTNSPAGPLPKAEETNDVQQTLRSYLQLQEQLHETLVTIERTRKEADEAAKANAEAITVRLETIEKSLSAQQKQEATLLRSSNRATLTAAGIFAGLGLLAMMFTAWFLLRAMNRLSTVVAALPAGGVLGPGQSAPFVSTEAQLINLNPMEQSSSRLLGVIDRLEKRIHELEDASHLSLPAEHGAHHHNGLNDSSAEMNDVDPEANSRATPPKEAASSPAEPSDRISVVLGKGQSLLSLDRAQEAIACFDEAIALDPQNADALVKKGTALERLKRLEDAIECYDRAIAANRSMTLAYLYKGGACNQLERFNEALECYELALRSQRKA